MLQIGCGAGFARDRTDAALPVVQTMLARGGPAVLIFEMLAERTLAFAQLERRADPTRGWAWDHWDCLACGTLAGHLLECGAQVTGGYFADPGYKDVPALDQVGYPIADVDGGGSIMITKAEGTGGVVNAMTLLSIPIEVPAAWAEFLPGPANAASARRQGG